MEQTEYSETSAYEIQAPENYPEENIQHTVYIFNFTFCCLSVYICLWDRGGQNGHWSNAVFHPTCIGIKLDFTVVFNIDYNSYIPRKEE